MGFENFPYTNFHELNLDWIAKIAKDFLEQYTHIQETITNGLEALDTKAANLQELLQEWYDTHSEDIANQLADALNDLNEWYTEHQDYLAQYLQTSIQEFNTAADEKAALTIASIPADYTALSNKVAANSNDIRTEQALTFPLITANNIFIESGFISTTGAELANDDYRRTGYIGIRQGQSIYYNHLAGTHSMNVISFYDTNKTYVSGRDGNGSWSEGTFTAPSDGFIRMSTQTQYLSYANVTTNQQAISPSNKVLDARTFSLVGVTNSFIEKGFIYTDGTDRTGDTYTRTGYIGIRKDQAITYDHLAGTPNTNVISFYDNNLNYQTGTVGNGAWSEGTFTAPTDGFVRMCTQTQYLSYAHIYPSEGLNVTAENSLKLGNKEAAYYGKTSEHGRLELTGKIADSFGDSITRQWYVQDLTKWQDYLKTWLDIGEIYNHGLDRSRVSGTETTAMNNDERINALNSDARIIFVMGGVNDWANNVPIGSVSYENTDVTTFFGACNTMFRKLTTRFPYSRIVALGCTFAYYPNRAAFSDPTGIKNNLNLASVDYSNYMMESARMNGIEHYDIGGNLNVNKENIADSFNVDETFFVHPNEKGRIMIAAFIAKSIL